MALTKKRRVFIEEYLRCWNGAEAARRAGYKFPARQASFLLTIIEVEAEIERRISELAMQANEVLLRLAEQARGLPKKYFHPTGELNGAMLVKEDKTHLIKKTKQTRNGLEVELYDGQRALVDIGRALGLFKAQLDVTTGGEPLRVVYIDDWRDKAPKATPGPADSNARPGPVQMVGGGATVAQDDDGDEHSD